MRRYFSLCIVLLTALSSGCYTAAEMRKLSEEKPDPRQAQVDQLWSCIQTVAAEEAWPIEVASRPGLLLATQWIERDTEHRERVRITVVVAPMGVAINVYIHSQHRAPGAAEWTDVTEPNALTRVRAQETALARRIHGMWEEVR